MLSMFLDPLTSQAANEVHKEDLKQSQDHQCLALAILLSPTCREDDSEDDGDDEKKKPLTTQERQTGRVHKEQTNWWKPLI